MKKQLQPLQLKKQGGYFLLEQGGNDWLTPMGKVMTIPCEKLGLAIIQEYQILRQHSGFLCKLCFTALDYILPNIDQIIENAVRHFDHDTLLHWSEFPEELNFAQQQRWQPMIAWFNQACQTELKTFYSFQIHHQSANVKEQFKEILLTMGAWQLTGFLSLAQELASSILATAVYQQKLNVPQAIDLSLLEEKVQIGKWGDDPFLQKKRQLIEQECLAAQQFLELLR